MNDRLTSLLDMLKSSPNEPFILFALAQECVKKELHSEALRYYERIVEFSPVYTGVYYHLGKLYEQLGRKTDALHIYKQGMEMTKQRGEHHAFSELQSALNLLNDEA